MIELSSPRWRELTHAYGPATALPQLLAQLRDLPDDEGDDEPWSSLWSALVHQGDVYSATFAAVPHVIAALARSPREAAAAYFHFPAWVEVCRHRNAVKVPDDLAAAYAEALARLPALVVQAAGRPWDQAFSACALSAMAAAKGQHAQAAALLELADEETMSDFNAWVENR